MDRAMPVTYCLTEPSPYAVMVGSRKLCGLAIRRYPDAWLIQGSLLLRGLPDAVQTLMPPAVLEAFRTQAITLEEAHGHPVTASALTAAVMQAWQDTWDAFV